MIISTEAQEDDRSNEKTGAGAKRWAQEDSKPRRPLIPTIISETIGEGRAEIEEDSDERKDARRVER